MNTGTLRNTIVTLAIATSIAIPASASAERARADLDSFSSVPTLAAPGTGTFDAKVKRKTGQIEYRLSYSGLENPVLQSHIHFGNPWENGGVIVFLCTNLGNAPSPDIPLCPDPSGTVEGIIEAADVIGPGGETGIEPGDFETLLDAIDAGATYVNVHTENHPAGQIRGQID